VLASLGGLLFACYLNFSIGPTIALFLGCELAITTSPIAGFYPKTLNLQWPLHFATIGAILFMKENGK
jgi:hypothetical protein